MALSRQWYTSANRALDDNTTALRFSASILFALKSFLTGAVSGTNGPEGARPSSANWTIDSSSDGVTASSADNLGGGTFTAAKWVRAAAASPHSWYVLKSPVTAGILDGPYYLLVSFVGASDQNVVFAISKNAFTGGTTSADPTSTNQSTYTSFPWIENTTTAGKAHFVTDAKGNFHFGASKNGSGLVASYVSFSELTDYRSSGDTNRAVLQADFVTSGRGCPRPSTNSSCRGLSMSGTALTSSTGKLGQLAFSGSNIVATAVATNAADATVDEVPFYGVYDTTAGQAGLRGRLPDVSVIGAQVAVGTLIPASSSDRAVWGELTIPTTVALSL